MLYFIYLNSDKSSQAEIHHNLLFYPPQGQPLDENHQKSQLKHYSWNENAAILLRKNLRTLCGTYISSGEID